MRIKVQFSEQSKCVVADVTVEGEQETETLLKAKELFIEAQKFAQQQTMKKL